MQCCILYPWFNNNMQYWILYPWCTNDKQYCILYPLYSNDMQYCIFYKKKTIICNTAVFFMKNVADILFHWKCLKLKDCFMVGSTENIMLCSPVSRTDIRKFCPVFIIIIIIVIIVILIIIIIIAVKIFYSTYSFSKNTKILKHPQISLNIP